MKGRLILIWILWGCTAHVAAQVNMELISKLTFTEKHKNTKQSDIWGFADKEGNEYAFVGLTGSDTVSTGGVSIISLKNPEDPKEIGFIEIENTTWWDMKTWNNHLYIVNERAGGLTIVDLNGLPNTDNLTVNHYTGPKDNEWTTAHNVYIDSTGFAYVFGTNRGEGGVIFLDLNKDPKKPEEAGVYDEYYAHDGYVQNNRLYVANVLDGFFTILDVSDKVDPKILGRRHTPSNFTHNIWVSSDEKYAFTTDEKRDAYIAAYDITDPADAKELGKIRSGWSEASIPHNTHWLNNYLVTSYYRDGVLIHDVSNPAKMVEVGAYDTHPWFGGGFNGCWGVYPFLPSGLIIASDIEGGLFVFRPNYQRAGFLEGNTYDQESGNTLKGVEVKLLNTQMKEFSDVYGAYTLGIFPSGTFDVVFSKLGYYPDTVRNVEIKAGETTALNDSLQKQEHFAINGTVKDSLTGDPVFGAKVRFEILYAGVVYTYMGTSDSTGNFTIEDLENANFNLFVGKWGYRTFCADTMVSKDKFFEIRLPRGYYDDFVFDFGWKVEGEAEPKEGKWERVVPKQTLKIKNDQQYFANPNADVSEDCGDMAFVTGNIGTRDWDDDLDSNKTILISPEIDFSSYTDPYISYYRWFFEATYFNADKENDTLKVYLFNNNGEEHLIDYLAPSSSNRGGWRRKTFKVNDFFNKPKDGYRLRIEIKDTPTSPNAEDIVEAGLDYFMVTEGNPIGIEEIGKNELYFDVFPNPFNENIVLRSRSIVPEVVKSIEMIDFSGRLVQRKIIHYFDGEITLNTPYYPKGMYFIRINTVNQSATYKVIKH